MAKGGIGVFVTDAENALKQEQTIRGTIGTGPDAEILGNKGPDTQYKENPVSENYNIIPGSNGEIMVDKELGVDSATKEKYLK